MQESGGILTRNVWQEVGVIRWCDWEGELRLVSTGLRLSGYQ